MVDLFLMITAYLLQNQEDFLSWGVPPCTSHTIISNSFFSSQKIYVKTFFLGSQCNGNMRLCCCLSSLISSSFSLSFFLVSGRVCTRGTDGTLGRHASTPPLGGSTKVRKKIYSTGIPVLEKIFFRTFATPSGGVTTIMCVHPENPGRESREDRYAYKCELWAMGLLFIRRYIFLI